MANIFLKKTMASMLNMPMEQVDAILNAAEAFKSNEIDRGAAIELFDARPLRLKPFAELPRLLPPRIGKRDIELALQPVFGVIGRLPVPYEIEHINPRPAYRGRRASSKA